MHVHTFTCRLVSTHYSVPSLCILCTSELIVSSFDKKYRFGVPFKVPSKLDSISKYIQYVCNVLQIWINVYMQYDEKCSGSTVSHVTTTTHSDCV